jgi:hypothetical protein
MLSVSLVSYMIFCNQMPLNKLQLLLYIGTLVSLSTIYKDFHYRSEMHKEPTHVADILLGDKVTAWDLNNPPGA